VLRFWRTAATMLLGAALVGGVLTSPASAHAAPDAGTALAKSCPGEVALYVVFASPRGVAKFVDSVLVRSEVVNGRTYCHFVGTSVVAVPRRPPVVTPDVAWSRPASEF
jgi:hypothetical protein